MNPFSKEIRSIRESKGIKQKDAADFLGYEQSYLSAIELGLKDPPKNSYFWKRLIKTYQLTADQQTHLKELLDLSNRVITIPKNASEEVFYLGHQLEHRFVTLSAVQIQLINVVLNMNAISMTDSMRRAPM